MLIIHKKGAPIFVCVDFWGMKQTLFGSYKKCLENKDFTDRNPHQGERLFKKINNIKHV